MPNDTPSLDSVFCAAVEIASAEERAAYVARACGDDVELRQRVEKLVAAHFQAGNFLERPAEGLPATGHFSASAAPPPPADAPEGDGRLIGPYQLLEAIGEGGMGTVWLAQQTEPIKRLVAVKLIKAGMDSKPVLARFEAERQALALMEHTNIARVLDAGETPPAYAGGSPRPYFVMELVQGVPITHYCDEHQLPVRERLALFVQVCAAIQHAHTKGIIHRDIKPSNVLVAEQDGQPVPKVIDFGVAKALHQPLTDGSLDTAVGQVVGTPQYMSPEQAELNQADIDTRSDIYSLGVLLYELLTGTTPLERERVQGSALLEVLRVIREEETPAPSARLNTVADLPAIAASRGLEAKQLRGVVRGELDWIVLKALEKDRNRRYETASAFALDVQRYLADEPVQACPPSAGYRLRKFLRRNRGPVLAAILLFLAMAGGLLGTTVGLIEAERQREKARQKANDAELAAAEARATSDFFVHHMLRATDPAYLPGRKLTVLEVLDNAASIIDTQFRDQPLVEAAVRHTMGTAYLNLGQYKVAERHLLLATEVATRLLGRAHRNTLASMQNLGTALLMRGKLKEARQLDAETVDLRSRLLGPDHPETLRSMGNLATALEELGDWKEARRLREDVLRRQTRVSGPRHLDTLIPQGNLAMMLRKHGNLKEALRLSRETVAALEKTVGPKHPRTLFFAAELADAHISLGQLTAADELLQKTLKLNLEVLGPDHPQTLKSVHYLARLRDHQGDLKEARRLYEETLQPTLDTYGPEHPIIRAVMNNLATVLARQGEWKKARQLEEAVLAQSIAAVGAEHPNTLKMMNNLAERFADQGLLLEARKRHEKVLELRRSILGTNHPDTLNSMSNLGLLLMREGKLEQARELLEKASAALQEVCGPEQERTLNARLNLAIVFAKQRHYAEARKRIEEVVAARVRTLGKEHPDTLNATSDLASVLLQLDRPDESLALHREVLRLRRQVQGEEHPATLTAMYNVATVLLRWGLDAKDRTKLEEARETAAEVVALSRRILGPRHPHTLDSMNRLAQTLGALGKEQEVHSILEEVVQGSREVYAPDHPTLLAVMRDQAKLLIRTGKYLEARDMREELFETVKRAFGPEHPRTHEAANDLAKSLNAVGTFVVRGDLSRRREREQLYWRALALVEPLVDRFPDNPRYRDTFTELCNNQVRVLAEYLKLDTQQRTEALRLARKAVTLMPQQSIFWNALGLAHYRNESWKDALAALDESVRLGKGNVWDCLFLAMTHWQLDHKEEARQWFDKATQWLQQNPTFQDKTNVAANEVRVIQAEAAALLGIKAGPKNHD